MEHFGVGIVWIGVNTEYTYKTSGFLFLRKVPVAGPATICLLTSNNDEVFRERICMRIPEVYPLACPAQDGCFQASSQGVLPDAY